MRQKLACIVGARPQFVKYGILRPTLAKIFDVSLIHTGQHTDPTLFSQIFADLKIPPPDQLFAFNGHDREERLADMHDNINAALQHGGYSGVVLFGDTDSTLAGVQAAVSCELAAIHIEAGERSHNLAMPEEQNRVITDRQSGLLCCASLQAQKNLTVEALEGTIVYTGDLMKDLLIRSVNNAKRLVETPYYYASIHRHYTRTHEDRLKHLLAELNSLPHPVIFSLHPSTAFSLSTSRIDLMHFSNIQVIAPVSYHDSISYQFYAEAVITDSGGMQKEAYWLKKPCITLRPETEWTETLANHCNQLFYSEGSLDRFLLHRPGRFDEQLYGDGHAAEYITDAINRFITC